MFGSLDYSLYFCGIKSYYITFVLEVVLMRKSGEKESKNNNKKK